MVSQSSKAQEIYDKGGNQSQVLMMCGCRTETLLQTLPRQIDQKVNKAYVSSSLFKALKGSQLYCYMVIKITKFAKVNIF